MNKYFSLAKLLLGWPLSLIALFFVSRIFLTRISDVNKYISNINFPLLILGVFIFLVFYFFRSYLWLLILKSQKARVDMVKNAYSFSFSEFKRYVPGNIWSFLSRGSMFSDLGVEKKTIFISILLDIQLVVIGCGIASLFSIPFLLNLHNLPGKLSALLPISIVGVIIYFIATAFVYSKKYENIKELPKNLILPGVPFVWKIKLTLAATLLYFLFGVGSYIVLTSVVPNSLNLITISSFFTFSLLVGYLSFIAPASLGIREAIITVGLAGIISLPIAGFSAIFTRLILIFSEIGFLIFIFIWKNYLKK